MTPCNPRPLHRRSGKVRALVTAGFCLSPEKQGLSRPIANTAPVLLPALRPIADIPAPSPFLSEPGNHPIQNP